MIQILKKGVEDFGKRTFERNEVCENIKDWLKKIIAKKNSQILIKSISQALPKLKWKKYYYWRQFDIWVVRTTYKNQLVIVFVKNDWIF